MSDPGPIAVTDPAALPFVKGLFHGALLVAVLPPLLYNLACLRRRPQPRHWVNVGAYVGLVALEIVNVAQHGAPKGSR